MLRNEVGNVRILAYFSALEKEEVLDIVFVPATRNRKLQLRV